jgi:hypothetical protein
MVDTKQRSGMVFDDDVETPTLECSTYIGVINHRNRRSAMYWRPHRNS